MFKLINDISALTGISILALEKLTDKASLTIAHDVHESFAKKESTTSIDIGIGQLFILHLYIIRFQNRITN